VAKSKKKPPAKKAAAKPAKTAKRRISPAKKIPQSKGVKPLKLKPAKPTKAPPKPAPIIKPIRLAQGRPLRPAQAKPIAKVAKTEKPAKSKAAKNNNGKAGVIIPPPAPLAAKPMKNQAGLSARELEHFRELLLAKRRELVGDMYSMEREALERSGENLSNLPLHMADMGTDNYEQEFTLGLMQEGRDLLREINTALQKIQNGTYAICEGTGKPIAKVRLEACPWTRYSIEHARKLENRGVR
jgi:RNA polymerase-binding transcription factor DksA